MQPMNATRQLAQYVHQSRWSDLPEPVRHEAVRAFVNWVGCAFGGATHSAVSSALAAVRELSTSSQCSVLGSAQRLDPLNAALINGLSASAYAFDDTHLSSIGHPTAPTAAALLAYAELHPVAGPDFLHALIIANEVQCRLSCALAVPPAQVHVGLYMTGLVGAIGVAAGIGKLMGLSEQQLVWAMGIGATQGGGFRATHASMCSGFIPANAGRNGFFAALLAAKNFTCTEDALGTTNGFLQVFGNPPNIEALTDRLGQHYECMNVAAKPFPAGCFIHPSIEACLDLVQSHDFESSEVERIELHVYKLGIGLTGKSEPRHGYDSQVSVYHWAAAVLHHRRAGLGEASDECVNDPAVIALRKRVHVTVCDDLQADEARAAVILRDGRRFETLVRPCLGSAQRPMTDSQIEAKLVEQASPLLGAQRAGGLARQCWNLRAAPDVRRAGPGFWG